MDSVNTKHYPLTTIHYNGRKAVIFTEWTTSSSLIGKMLSTAGIKFVELTGRIPVPKRQALIDEFSNNSECRVFLSTDAGGTGLNLQAADCVINFEPPWNPSRLNQRIGRVCRIGQKSKSINVVNLIAKNSIEERIVAGLQLKTEVFEGVFEEGASTVEFSGEKRAALLNRLREMMGEEPVPITADPKPSEALPDETPHFLNPDVLSEEESAETGEATETTVSASAAAGQAGTREDGLTPGQAAISQASPEQIESVLDTGMRFIGGLLEMATGQGVTPTADSGKLVEFDKNTGEVTLKFRLPGF